LYGQDAGWQRHSVRRLRPNLERRRQVGKAGMKLLNTNCVFQRCSGGLTDRFRLGENFPEVRLYRNRVERLRRIGGVQKLVGKDAVRVRRRRPLEAVPQLQHLDAWRHFHHLSPYILSAEALTALPPARIDHPVQPVLVHGQALQAGRRGHG
jgi:hypothetical protein